MKKLLGTTVVFIGVAVAMSMAPSHRATAEMPEVTDDFLAIGEATYGRECSACHGAEGAGDGPAAHYLNPRPRNFELGVYKFRSTPSGEVPTEHDLFKTITNGINNSMMPAFGSLSEEERWALVAVIQRFGGIEDEEPQVIEVSAEPTTTAASVENGALVYEKLKCAACHGAEGWGDGSSSLTLKNDAKERIYPANITRGVYKGGSEGKDLYLRIASGLDGSPMPSYSAEATPEEIWDLVHYMQSIVEEK